MNRNRIFERMGALSKQMVAATTEEEREKLKQEYEVLKKERDKQYDEHIAEWFNTLEPFNGNIDKIPSIPKPSKEVYENIVIPNLIRCGAISKKDLEIGKTYLGDCRNASEAVWNGKVFVYKRYKFGFTYDEEINHFEDDDGSDLFVPIKIKEE